MAYDPTKRHRKKGTVKRHELNDLAVFHSQKDSGERYKCSVINFKTNTNVVVNARLAHGIGKQSHKWNVHLLAIGRESNGKARFEVDEVPLSEPLAQHQLVDYLCDRHKEFAVKFQERNTLTNVAWLAVMNHDTISNEEIDAILTKQDAWG